MVELTSDLAGSGKLTTARGTLSQAGFIMATILSCVTLAIGLGLLLQFTNPASEGGHLLGLVLNGRSIEFAVALDKIVHALPYRIARYLGLMALMGGSLIYWLTQAARRLRDAGVSGRYAILIAVLGLTNLSIIFWILALMPARAQSQQA